MDYLRQGIHLRGYAQKQPKQEYKRESFELFSEMLDKVKFDITSMLARVRVRDEDEVAEMEAADRRRHGDQAHGRRQLVVGQFEVDQDGGCEGQSHPSQAALPQTDKQHAQKGDGQGDVRRAHAINQGEGDDTLPSF